MMIELTFDEAAALSFVLSLHFPDKYGTPSCPEFMWAQKAKLARQAWAKIDEIWLKSEQGKQIRNEHYVPPLHKETENEDRQITDRKHQEPSGH